MLGRVSSLDWLISIGLLPLSFALTAPVAAAVGARATLVGAALVGGAVTLGAYFLPGMKDIERGGGAADPALVPPLAAAVVGGPDRR
jgi:DHA3 family tetracycline resistance protein-like MFS transporter